MATSASDLAAAGLEALRRGDANAARRAFGRAAQLDPGNPDAHLGLAYACQADGDAAAALSAVEQVLRRDPASLRALALRGDLQVAAGQVPEAAASYRAALQSVPDREALPHALRQEFDRAAAMLERVTAALSRQFRQHLGEPASPRMAQALDILTGERRYYPSEPRHFLMPELPTVQFHDRAAFPWLDAIEAATDDIRRELLAVLADPGGVVPYLQSDPQRPASDAAGLLDNPAWSAFHLRQNGQVVEAHAARCPRTMAALQHAPLTRMAGRSPAALFSILRPGAHIPPHHGFVNTRLIVHLPLVVPPGCSLRVGNETREWVEGRAWLFDDTIEHEAWNRSDRVRAILLFEVWRPELSEAEKRQIDHMFEAIDRQRGIPADWGI